MKNSLSKLMAVSSAALLLGGTIAPVVNAQQETPATNQERPVATNETNETGFTTKEQAEYAAKEALKEDEVNKSFKVSQGADDKYYYVLSPEEPAVDEVEVEVNKIADKLADAGVSDFYVNQVRKAKTVEGAQNLADEITKSVINGIADDLAAQGVSDFYVNQVRKANTIEGARSLAASVLDNFDPLASAKEAAKDELRAAGITSSFFLEQIDKAQTAEGIESLKNELLRSHEASKPAEEENNETGFSTEEAARAAAEAALENDPINNSYTVSQGANGRYFYLLSPVEGEKPETPAELPENNENGYLTEEAARKAAEEALKNDPINNSYTVSLGANGRYYYLLSPLEAEKPGAQDPQKPGQGGQTDGQKPGDQKPGQSQGTKTEAEKATEGAKAAKGQQEGNKLPKTGETSSTAIFGAAALSILAGLGLVAPALKKED